MIENTKILRSLTADEITFLKQELLLVDHLWESHHLPTSLDEGRTVYLRQRSIDGIITDRFDLVPNTKKLLDSIIAPHHYGRCYWHKLMPGESIKPHKDRMFPFIKRGELEHRYQIYLDGDDTIKLMIDGKHTTGSKYSNCLIDFDLKQKHSYLNTSSEPWYLLVFDAINKPLLPRKRPT
jgi:hypothetical protein